MSDRSASSGPSRSRWSGSGPGDSADAASGDTLPFRAVAVVGLGLMGGAVARALHALPDRPEIRGASRSEEDLRRGREEGVLDAASDEAEEVLPGADLVVYATPLHAALGLVGPHRQRWDPHAVITDVIGLKSPLLDHMQALGEAHRYVGAHPMAGAEGQGYGAAPGEILRGALIWLVHAGAPPETRDRVERFWKAVGGQPRWTEARDHDRAMVWCSHLPQLLSNALAGALDAQGFTPRDLGPGGRDMVRLAGSSPDIWKDLFAASAPSLGTALTSVSRALEVMADLLARRDVDRLAEFMERTRQWRGEGP